jgi:tetratricopeptide (TPR) repeat protein/2-polyprenyl-3-methyl-5-hydroxy-6-metoxy-1,4-benzoquinol methylase
MNIQTTLINAVTAHQQGDLGTAKSLYKKILRAKPLHFDALHLLGVIYFNEQNLTESKQFIKRALVVYSEFSEAHFNLGNTLMALGELYDAKESYQKAIKIKPDYIEAYSNLGLVLRSLSDLSGAQQIYERALELKSNVQLWYNYGNVLSDLELIDKASTAYQTALNLDPTSSTLWKDLGNLYAKQQRHQETLSCLERALELNPAFVEAHNDLGNAFRELGQLDAAEKSYKFATRLNPKYALAHSNLGNVYRELGKFNDSEVSCRTAVSLEPEFAIAHLNLGNALINLGRLRDAEASYKSALALNPCFIQAYINLGATLNELDRVNEAIDVVIKAIEIKPTLEAKSLYTKLIARRAIPTWNQSLATLVNAALQDSWGMSAILLGVGCKLLRVDVPFFSDVNDLKNLGEKKDYDSILVSAITTREYASSILLRTMLISGPIPDRDIELALTCLRHHLLKQALLIRGAESDVDAIPPLYCSLAQQCFINEYVYFQTPDEIKDWHQLRHQLTQALKDGLSIPAIWAIALACYFPLHSVAGAEKLLHKRWSDEVKKILIQQIEEPLEELNLRATIGALTSFDNAVSLLVQNQYEENPYPRWVRPPLPRDLSKKYINTYLQTQFPLSSFKRLDNDRDLHVLIAGCGTGQHPIGVSQSIRRSSVLAVDLSMTSLAYAKRKTIELGIENIDYKQADILKLGTLNQTFDVIESAGVLHHLENPFEGWKVLLSLLRPHGLMKLGFYSELARQDIVRVRKMISEAGIGSSAEAIREYRRHLLTSHDPTGYGFATSSSDFFSTSACRDLLFHVQEHRMTIPILADFFKEHDLNFLGFDIDSSVIRAYKNRFPTDPSATDLNNWHIYEMENPNTFIGMYQFWVQKQH